MTDLQTNAEEKFNQYFKTFELGLNGQACSYVHEIRKNAFSAFQTSGFPNAKAEEWKYAKSTIFDQMMLQPRMQKDLQISAQLKKNLLENREGIDANFVVLLDGFFSPELSKLSEVLPKGAVIGSLANGFATHQKCIKRYFGKLDQDHSALVQLNTAFALDGVFIYLPKGSVLEKPVYVTTVYSHKKTASSQFSRIMVVCESQSQIKLVEDQLTELGAGGANNLVTEIVLGDSAICEHVSMGSSQSNALQMAHVLVEQHNDSSYKLHNFSCSSKMFRNEVKVSLSGPGSSCNVTALTLAKDKEQAADAVSVAHKSPHCTSYQLYKGIFKEDSAGTFYGKIKVDKDAVQTNANQTSRSLLLSENATCHARPQLEIDTDDVKCTHGSTVGQLDENALFYLSARGIKPEKAASMLTLAFAKEALENIGVLFAKKMMEHKLETWLSLKENKDGTY